VVFDRDEPLDATEVSNTISFRYDKEDVRSAAARIRIEEVLGRVRDRMVEQRKAAARLPETFDRPFVFAEVDLSSPPSILGQILPLVLVLMTITGAIYPAIDLTAGERERGTLESLMASPVPVIDLIVGKFLVVTTVALMGAALNLTSVTATVYFGGFAELITSTEGAMPLGTMAFILLALIPFAVLMAAIMIAVCSFARTFKEAQNYVTPVILAVLIPGGIAALPATRLEGVMMVMPVGNMVLLARDMLLGAHIPPWAVALVIVSTTLYAGAAVAIAAGVFGRESVVFNDAASLASLLRRRMIKPRPVPTVSMALLVAAVLFPLWFFVQGALSPAPGEDARRLLITTAWAMPLLFFGVPLALAAYAKIDPVETFALRRPEMRHVLAAVLIGLSAWAPAHEINALQQRLLGIPDAVVQSAEMLARTLKDFPLPLAVLVIALVPAVAEEFLFRGFLLSGVRAAFGKWGAILVTGAIFGVFHFFFFRFTVTAGLGVVLAYLCWQSRSILPAVLAHLLHNGLGVVSIVRPEWTAVVIGDDPAGGGRLHPLVLGVAMAATAAGIALAARGADDERMPGPVTSPAPLSG
jgi:ABC-2 type transport system permease protein/sodium transport system permease protein